MYKIYCFPLENLSLVCRPHNYLPKAYILTQDQLLWSDMLNGCYALGLA